MLYLRNEMSKYIRETGKLCLPSISIKLISVSLGGGLKTRRLLFAEQTFLVLFLFFSWRLL
jgi:hypothetical protein